MAPSGPCHIHPSAIRLSCRMGSDSAPSCRKVRSATGAQRGCLCGTAHADGTVRIAAIYCVHIDDDRNTAPLWIEVALRLRTSVEDSAADRGRVIDVASSVELVV